MTDLLPIIYPELIKGLYTAARAEICGEEHNPEIVYHYTSMEIAQLILENNTIRFSHTYFMNDSKEIRKGLEIIWKTLLDTAENYHKTHSDIAWLLQCLAITLILRLEDKKARLETLADLEKQGFKEANPDQFTQFEQFNQSDVFISCFSEERDSLPMWYMYANHAKGAALGFSFDTLTSEHNALLKERGSLQLVAKIIYDENKFKAVVEKVVRDVITFTEKHKAENGNIKKLQNGEVGNDFFFSINYYLAILAASFKDKAFAHEREWRLFTMFNRHNSVANRKFATASGVLKPHHFMSYNTSNVAKLKELIVAPGNPNDEDWIEIYLKSIGATQCAVIPSDIPFRNV